MAFYPDRRNEAMFLRRISLVMAFSTGRLALPVVNIGSYIRDFLYRSL
jgi:hypothetical protein